MSIVIVISIKKDDEHNGKSSKRTKSEFKKINLQSLPDGFVQNPEHTSTVM